MLFGDARKNVDALWGELSRKELAASRG
jgi:hypothetical protein